MGCGQVSPPPELNPSDRQDTRAGPGRAALRLTQRPLKGTGKNEKYAMVDISINF